MLSSRPLSHCPNEAGDTTLVHNEQMFTEEDREQGPWPTLSQINPPKTDCAGVDVEAKVHILDQDVRTCS